MLEKDALYSKIGKHKPQNDYKKDSRMMRKINVRLYELTGNDMYLWLGGHFNELKKIEDGQN